MDSATTITRLDRVEPHKVDLSRYVPRMLDLVKNTKLPETSLYDSLGNTAGIDLKLLKQLQKEWLEDFDWTAEEEEINRSVQAVLI